MENKTIEIACEGNSRVALDELQPFQGELKSLSEANAAKLRLEIIERGFSFPLFVWVHEGKNFVIDGHQRLRVLADLAAEGYTIPAIPVCKVEARNFKEAKHKLLTAASQYGLIDDMGLTDFIKDAGLNADDILGTLEFPGVDLSKIQHFFDDLKLGIEYDDDNLLENSEIQGEVENLQDFLVITFADHDEFCRVHARLGLRTGQRKLAFEDFKGKFNEE
jgi:hypothetical protein